jgi:hypothetical protein
MDKKILGAFIIYFPPIAYVAFTLVTKKESTGIDWTSVVITGVIGIISSAIGNRIKNKEDIE